MTVHDLLDIIQEQTSVKICFGDGIRGACGDLNAVLNDEALSNQVDCVDFDMMGIKIHIVEADAARILPYSVDTSGNIKWIRWANRAKEKEYDD